MYRSLTLLALLTWALQQCNADVTITQTFVETSYTCPCLTSTSALISLPASGDSSTIVSTTTIATTGSSNGVSPVLASVSTTTTPSQTTSANAFTPTIATSALTPATTTTRLLSTSLPSSAPSSSTPTTTASPTSTAVSIATPTTRAPTSTSQTTTATSTLSQTTPMTTPPTTTTIRSTTTIQRYQTTTTPAAVCGDVILDGSFELISPEYLYDTDFTNGSWTFSGETVTIANNTADSEVTDWGSVYVEWDPTSATPPMFLAQNISNIPNYNQTYILEFQYQVPLWDNSNTQCKFYTYWNTTQNNTLLQSMTFNREITSWTTQTVEFKPNSTNGTLSFQATCGGTLSAQSFNQWLLDEFSLQPYPGTC
ncbi:hypothetical protein LTR10_016826 [Elasticomyces elasticus]|uniref:CBM-cenC domain-containing protein n=1 Tax=Exophiala sideris TaxID=1016849 RepID=A0ABR0JK20_9EURO|nr:hypothetical protein LTR10_016826 [Elasticomyces elasticus]KAK5035404.1 hypothetical protein LTS07_002841 [Exophiala sideris]KAK5039245.1 hypothetical protein LTR13_003501 [Exophiala sideris]KAK5066328.1 hypothetical protein LTR69_002847 [Exophiala sideris]KAK5187005.1 hypothetical protein LTR44_001012 [Eurotiomycetes sp. CCFEE 6388]